MPSVRPLVIGLAASLAICGGTLAGDGDAGIYNFIYRENPGIFGGRAPLDPPPPPPVRELAVRSYCVRTCDGYYFSIGFPRNDAEFAQHESMCTSSCGGAQMRLYSSPIQSDAGVAGSGIDRAADDAGALYTALPSANLFKTKGASSPTCSCQGSANGLPQIPLLADPTLRNGDIVVMADGLKVFRGTPGALHQDSDFVSVAGARYLPSAVRQQMLSLENRIAE